ncbi:DUF4132 domain-containing protein [Carboxylicivirga sp. RSCT41]|uniref:DUF4132 domain-containing protein n=1 Tax=Carboxylicivirga agarovorans TaxID=3417570 RepID=UPI003D34BC6B
MGLFDLFKKEKVSEKSTVSEFENVIVKSYKEHDQKDGYFYDIKANQLSIYKNEVLSWDDRKKIDFIFYLIKTVNEYTKNQNNTANHQLSAYNSIRQAYVSQLFKIKISMSPDVINSLFKAFVTNKRHHWQSELSWPWAHFINQIGRQYPKADREVKTVLEDMQAYFKKIDTNYYEKEIARLIAKVEELLFKSANGELKVKPVLFTGKDAFTSYANDILNKESEEALNHWYRLLAMTQKASGSKPSAKYLKECKNIIEELGRDNFTQLIINWFSYIIDLKESETVKSYNWNGQTHQYSEYDFLSGVNSDMIKGLVWCCSHFHSQAIITIVSRLAERSFKKIPGKGPAAQAIGNACIFVLYKSKGLDGIGHLSRLKLKVKQSSTQKLIEKYLHQAADEKGVTIHEIEDLSVNAYGLTNGSKEVSFDDYKALLTITSVGKTSMRWFKPDGTEQKTIPKQVKDKHAKKLKQLKDSVKQINLTTSAQRDRLDRMFRSNRQITMENFVKLYLEHGLMSYLAKGIIWIFDDGSKKQSCIYHSDNWCNVNGEVIEISHSSNVSLWHPATSTVEEVQQWRAYLVDKQIQQPLKQAFREVYLLTDAELKTKTYSNRMAAHILKQHQFNSLAKVRGWKFALMGAFDNGVYNDAAEIELKEHGLQAEYWVNEVNADDAMNDTGIWNYIATDQIRFTKLDTKELIDLVDVPPLVFSEVFRDVDLFVGVASVGNDPAWSDSGGLPAYRDYWNSYSFGDLSELAKSRKEILERLIPRLKINKVSEVKERFLVVKGKLRTYKIHIGSTNILMEPNDQYLCIVPDRSKKDNTNGVYLPFEGDAGLSVILSKAFLLADDDKIADTTITSQINNR